MNASHFKNAGRKQRGNDARNVQRRPEGSQANRKLLRRIEVGCEQDCAHRQNTENTATQNADLLVPGMKPPSHAPINARVM